MPRALRIYTGLSAVCHGRGHTGPAILTFLFDAILNGDMDPITIEDLCTVANSPREQVLEALKELSDRNLIAQPKAVGVPQPWSSVGSFRVAGFSIDTGLEQSAMAMEPEPGSRKVLGSSRNPLSEEMYEEVAIDGLVYRAEVRTTGEAFALDVTRKGLGDDAMPQLVVDGELFDSLTDVWDWWEEFLGDRETGVGEDDQDAESDQDDDEGQEAA